MDIRYSKYIVYIFASALQAQCPMPRGARTPVPDVCPVAASVVAHHRTNAAIASVMVIVDAYIHTYIHTQYMHAYAHTYTHTYAHTQYMHAYAHTYSGREFDRVRDGIVRVRDLNYPEGTNSSGTICRGSRHARSKVTAHAGQGEAHGHVGS